MHPCVLLLPTQHQAHGQYRQYVPRRDIRVRQFSVLPSLGFKETQIFFIPSVTVF